MQCAKCGVSNRNQAKFCEECGAALALACPQCGVPVLVGKKFCGDCGAALYSAPLTSAQRSSSSTEAHRPFLATSPSPTSYTPPHLASRIRSSKAALEGERKIITVLFADIKGSMEIMESLGPEESQRLLNPCIQLMMDAVHRTEGTIGRVLGDGVMALFGAPLALEDHAHRALYAALRMHETVRRYADELQQRHGIELQIRVGVNTGDVVVGAIGNDLFMEYTPVGHAVGIAARMEALAAPGSTCIAASTYGLTQHAFRFASRGTTKVKGVTEPCAVYELLDPDPASSRLTARTAVGFAPFLGRAQELARLEEFVQRAESGHGQVVLLTGEAGLGKSRLIEELKPFLRERDFLLIAGEGFAYGKTRAYAPLIDMLKRYCNINDQDPPDAYEEKLRSTLADVHTSLTAFVPVFLELLSATVVSDPAIAALSTEAKLQQVLNGIKQLIALQCRLQPVALLVEDLHWLDNRSIAFLHALTTGLGSLPVLLLCSSRPNHFYPWETLSFTHKVQLAPLPQDVRLALFTALVGESPTISTLASAVCQRSEGNPFFLEEIVQNLRETGILHEQKDAVAPPRSPADWTLPPTVQSVLASRLDRLPAAAKSLLQTAAVIGRESPRPVLALVSGMEESAFEQTLDLLQEREFLYEAALYPESIYSFKHALIQEVAYHELLQEHRSTLHEHVGGAIEKLFPDKLSEYASLLAYHYSRSANTNKALHYLDLAGRRASTLYADADAQYFWEECLRLLLAQPPSLKRDQQEVRIRLHLINVLSRQYNDDTPIRSQFAAAEAVCERLQDARLLAELNATLAIAYVLRGKPQPGLTHARTAKNAADTLQDLHLQIITAGPLAHLLWIDGAFEEALQVAESGLSLVQEHGLTPEQRAFVVHPHAQCFAIAGASHGFLGNFPQGVAALQQAVVLTQRHNNRIPQAVVHWGLALISDLYGEHVPALEAAEHALAIMAEVSPTTGVLLVGSLQEYLTAISSPTSPTLHLPPASQLSLAKLTRTWQEKRAFHELAGVWLAEIAARTKRDKEEAQQLAREALATAEVNGSRWFLCAAHLTLGRILAEASPEPRGEAETHLRAAVDLATIMRSLPLLAHAAAALGDLLLQRSGAAVTAQQLIETPQERQTDPELHQAQQYLQQATALTEQLGMKDFF